MFWHCFHIVSAMHFSLVEVGDYCNLLKQEGVAPSSLMEWLLSDGHIIHWGSTVENSANSENKILGDLKRYLSKNNLYIGPSTFTSGFILVLVGACRRGYVNIVQYVLHHHKGEFDINQLILCHPNSRYLYRKTNSTQLQQEFRKETLVHAAIPSSVTSKSTKLLKLLVSHGASVNIPDCCSVTPLLKALSMPHSIDTIKYLVKAGANIDYQDTDGRTPLMYSVNQRENLAWLLKAGADSTITDKDGYTVVHEAIRNAKVGALEVLLSFNISPFSNTEKAKLPLFLANEEDFTNFFHHKFFDFLLDDSICPPNLRIDFLLLVASYLFFRFTENKVISPHYCWDKFQNALTLRAQLKLPPPNLSEPIEAYGGLTEVTSIEEFEERYSDFTNTSIQINLAYQCLIIRERCVGYGDNSQINCLISFGEWMIYINYYTEGLLLWLRATEMLLYRLTKDSVMVRCKLQFLLKKFLKACAELYIDPLLKPERKKTAANVDCQDLFVTIVSNLIECQHHSSERYKRCHVHHYSRLYEDSYHNFLTLLYHLSQSQLQRADLHSLGCKAVAKCFRFITSSCWPSNLMILAIKCYHYTDEAISFLTLLLEWGGYESINEVAYNGSRPLGLVSSKKVAKLLVSNGAHVDAAGINNHHLDDFFHTPLPLCCLSAKSVVANAIPYRSISLPSHIIDFIALHDPADITLKVQFMN